MAVPPVFSTMSAVASLLGFGIGIPMIYLAVRRSRNRNEALKRVEKTEARVTKSTVERRRDTRQTDEGAVGKERYVYRPVVRFRYGHGGETYESGNKSYNMPFGAVPSESRAKETAKQYPEGEKVTVYVDPENPKEGFLEVEETRQKAGAFFLGVIGAFTTLIGIMGGLVFALLTFVL
jgi:hypothetical protein